VRDRVTAIEHPRFRRFIRVLVLAYPPKFRELYGEGLEDAYVDLVASMRQRGSRFALPRVAVLALWHSLRDGALERLTSRPRNVGTSSATAPPLRG
jgi:hypothetical protein